MANLSTKIKLYCEANLKTIDFVNDVRLANDGDGKIYIKHWNVEGITKPTDSELNAFETEAKGKEDLLTVQQNRRSAYPSYAEQFDYIYHNGIEKWKTDIINPIKTKYPKPE